MEAFDYLGLTGRRWRVGDSVFEALPECGARLMRWKWRGYEVLYWPQSFSKADQIAEAYGGNPVLFPFTARCFVNGEPYQWTDSNGIRRPMPMHGFARQGNFALEDVNETGFTARLVPDLSVEECYPYQYSFRVRYHFKSNQLTCKFLLENRDRCPIPWSAGHHFYFRVPLIEGVATRAHDLDLAASRVCQVGMKTGGKLVPLNPFASHGKLDRETLSDAMIHYGLLSNEACLKASSDREEASLIIRIENDALLPSSYAFVTWSPSLEEPFYCIEPWMGPSNSAEHREGLHWVQPGEEKSFEVTIKYLRVSK